MLVIVLCKITADFVWSLCGVVWIVENGGVKHSACHVWTLHNKPQVTKIELQSSSTTIPFPGVYYAIICSARKQIPLTWFLFNYSTWKSFLLPLFLWTWEKEETTLPNKKKKETKKVPPLSEKCISPSLSVSIHKNPPSALILFKL